MQDKKEIVIIGYSGHGFVVAEAAISAQEKVIYYADKTEVLKNPFELIYLGFEGNENFRGWDRGLEFILGVGDNRIREKTGLLLLRRNETVRTIIHPDSSISQSSHFGVGVFVARGVSVNSLAEIGDYAILNTGAVIEHECKIGRASHIAPGAVLAGNVEVGERSFVGANSVIKQGIKIGKDVIVGAGSVVLEDVPDGIIIAGNPSRRIK